MVIVFFIVSLLASVVGTICGIGGGVIIKPALDLFDLMSVSAISFLSGCTVLSMSLYSVGHSLADKEKAIDAATGTPLAIGAAVGGITGKFLFTAVRGLFENANTVGAVQSLCLLLITVGTLIYTLKKSEIETHHVKSVLACLAIGFALGVMSSFLGIGGGPINLVVLSFFFSMETKMAAQNSLYIILFSQVANLMTAVLTAAVPEYDCIYLAVMVVGGITGGILGRTFHKRMDNNTVEKLFIWLMLLIIAACVYNTWQYAVV